jgi:hypothetical protein
MAEATLRKFISVVPDEEGKTTGAFAATKSVNRMGHAITGIGKSFLQVNELVKFQNEWILGIKDKEIERIDDQYKKEKDDEAEAEKKKRKRANLAKDIGSEKLQADGKKLGVKLFKKDKKDKNKWGWVERLLKAMSPIFNAIQWFAQTVITYVVFKWLGDEKNKENVQKFLKFISSLAKFAWWLTENSIGLLMDGVTKTFSWDPNKSTIENTFGALQILGGLAGIWAVSRLLMPWKILSDVRAMAALGTAVTAAEASGCGPRGRRYRGPKGPDGKPKFDPTEVQRRAKNIRRIRRNKRLAKLYRRLSALQEAGAKLVRKTASNTKALIEISQAALKSEITRLTELVDEKGARKVGTEIIESGLKKGQEAVKPFVEVVENIVEEIRIKPIDGQAPKPSYWDSLSKWVHETALPSTKNALVSAKDATIDAGKFMWREVIVPSMKNLNELGAAMLKHGDRLAGSIKHAGGNLYEMGAGMAKGFQSTVEMLKDPKKLMKAVQSTIKPKIKKIVKENPLVKNILDLRKDPDAIGTVFKQIKGSQILKDWKMMMKEGYGTKTGRKAAGAIGMGPIDLLIDIAMSIFDYAYLGESPVNAFMKAAGSFAGYGVGFSLVSLIPGAQGWGSLLGGIAGAMLGEMAGNALAHGMGAISEKMDFPGPGGFYNMRDPLAKAILGDETVAHRTSDGNIFTADFQERPFIRHPKAANFEFGNPNLQGDAKGKPYSEGGHVPLASWAKGKNYKKPTTKMPAYMSLMDHVEKRTPYQIGKATERIRGSEINTTPMMSELSLRKVRRVKEMQMHTHVVAVTQPVIKTNHIKATPPSIHYSSSNPHVSMFSK